MQAFEGTDDNIAIHGGWNQVNNEVTQCIRGKLQSSIFIYVSEHYAEYQK